ncbi:hypothetical protein ABZ816_39770 [Actinosynnema sp. NPDC047251]|nr:hypothetical protein [Saccharothrix espanaensis]
MVLWTATAALLLVSLALPAVRLWRRRRDRADGLVVYLDDKLHADVVGRVTEVDLVRQEVTGGRKADEPVALSELDSYVSIRGRFRVDVRGRDTVVLLAPFGDPDDPDDAAKVRVSCAVESLRGIDLPSGVFKARCLGRVNGWNAERRELAVVPVAVYL